MMNLFIPSRNTLILMISLIALIILLVFISFFNRSDTSIPTSSPQPSNLVNPNLLPFSSSIPETPQSVYRPKDLEDDFNRIENKKPLTSNDSAARSQLISSLGNKSGVLNQTSEYKIEYVKAPDLFMIEILTENTGEASKKALNWFYGKGLSQEGVCNLPVMIYLNYAITDSLTQKGITFNPIPEGCQ